MKKWFAFFVLLVLTFTCVTALAADDIDASKKVSKVEIGTLPTKIAYVVGETFSLEGGTVIVTYDDDSTDEVPMSAAGISIKEPGMKASGTKTVTLKAGKKSARFTVNVANNSFNAIYNLQYDGAPEAETVVVVKGETAEEKLPVRDGYTFFGWYVDADYTEIFNFKTEIMGDVNLFALWQKTGVDYVDITFNYGYYGKKLAQYSYPVEAGTAVAAPSAEPVRMGYTFAAWTDENGAAYDFAAPVSTAMTLTASWTKATTGVQTYVFEAEDTNLSGKTGPAVSGTANEIGMIVAHEDRNSSNGRAVGYLYQFGNSLEFYLSCDADMNDVTLSLSLSAEMDNLNLDSSTFGIYLNDEKLNYQTIVIDEVPAFNIDTYTADVPPYEYFLIGEGLSFKEGANLVRLVTENNESYAGTTMVAHAPLVDCLKVETEGIVIWDENYGVPALENYKH